MAHPDWVMKHKAKGTEIRKLGSYYYLYKIRSEYDKEKKRAKKITEKFLGKITEEGLIKPKRERIIESQKNISVKEFGASQFIAKESKDIILVGDKGFYSAYNVKELETKRIRYILPLKRNSQFIDYSPLKQVGRKQFDGHFLFENRVIWHYERVLDGKRIVTFLDNFLKVEEERDFLIRVNEGKLRIEEFHENEGKFGTISIITGLDLPPQKIFELLKSRVEIEVTFDTFKNVLNADRSYMRDDSAMEGWMFMNFIALLLYYKVYGLLISRDILSRCSPKDAILHLSRVFNVKIGENWIISEIPKKTRLLIEKLGIDMSIT